MFDRVFLRSFTSFGGFAATRGRTGAGPRPCGCCHDDGVVSSGAGNGVGAGPPERASQWAARAELAERAVRARHLRRLWGLPGTSLGVSGWPASPGQRAFRSWNYWWQAHVLDCLVDAYLRSPDAARRLRVSRFVNGIRIRNGKDWLNDYYDDMAWLALALLRAEQYVGVRRPGAVKSLAGALHDGWTEDAGGGIWWRLRDKYDENFKNVPANGPAAILFAKLRDERAFETARWIESTLVDPQTGIVWDGLHVDRDGGGIHEIGKTAYTYCQGVYLGACIELASWGNDREPEKWAERAARTVTAAATHLTSSSSDADAEPLGFGLVLRGQGGGDGGLFAGILARYLTQAALTLPDFGRDYAPAAFLAAETVLASARAAWHHRTSARGGPLFAPEWCKPAAPPHPEAPERDLSVQAGAWMLLESAALLARRR